MNDNPIDLDRVNYISLRLVIIFAAVMLFLSGCASLPNCDTSSPDYDGIFACSVTARAARRKPEQCPTVVYECRGIGAHKQCVAVGCYKLTN